jgi:hypothetical protein
VETTWRDILNAAITVGRDLTPWLVNRPHRAAHELLARTTPLTAYLRREHDRLLLSERPRLVPSIAYSQGAERSAQGAFAYRLGMTMTEWACRGLMGLGPTMHAESARPPGAMDDWFAAGSLPDLFGTHPVDRRLWLVEAKAARWIGLPQLKKGRDQLLAGSALVEDVPHRLVLCGASVEEEVFVTVDHIATGGPDTWPDHLPPFSQAPPEGSELTDPAGLVEFARSQMLIYLYLNSLERDRLTVVPVAERRSAFPERSRSILTLVERDPVTEQVRERLRERPPVDSRDLMGRENMDDLITAPLHSTGIRVGLSRGLFTACERLRRELAVLVEETQDSETIPQIRAPGLADRLPEEHDSEEQRERLTARARRIRTLERERGVRLRRTVQEGYTAGRERPWRDLLGIEPPVDTTGGGMLEAFGEGTYLAVTPQTPVLDPREG